MHSRGVAAAGALQPPARAAAAVHAGPRWRNDAPPTSDATRRRCTHTTHAPRAVRRPRAAAAARVTARAPLRVGVRQHDDAVGDDRELVRCGSQQRRRCPRPTRADIGTWQEHRHTPRAVLVECGARACHTDPRRSPMARCDGREPPRSVDHRRCHRRRRRRRHCLPFADQLRTATEVCEHSARQRSRRRVEREWERERERRTGAVWRQEHAHAYTSNCSCSTVSGMTSTRGPFAGVCCAVAETCHVASQRSCNAAGPVAHGQGKRDTRKEEWNGSE
jgi:hypothetical protein